MRDCSGALGLPSTMPAEPLVGSLLLPGCTLSTLRPRPHGLVSLRCPVPKASPCPFPTDPPPPPWAAAATGEDQTPRSSFVTTPCSAYRPEYGDLPLPGSPRPTPKPFLQH